MMNSLQDFAPFISRFRIIAVGLTVPALAIVANNSPLFISTPLLPVVNLGLLGVLLWAGWRMLSKPRQALSLAEEVAYQLKALNSHSIVSITDEKSRHIFVNDLMVRSTGYSREELLGQPASLLYPETGQATYRMIRATLASGRSWSGETQLKRKDGSLMWTRATIVPQFDAMGRPVRAISVRTDITEIKIADADRNMRQSLHQLRDEVYMFDRDTLRYRYMNEQAMETSGWNEDVYSTKTVYDRHGVDFANDFLERAKPLLDGTTHELNHEIEIKGRFKEVNLQLIESAGGSARFVAIVRDISERRALEKNKDNFISTVSHELRTPLTSIKGSLGLVLSGAAGELNEKARQMLDIAHRNTNRLVLIINDILDLEKITAGRMEFHFEEMDMRDLISDAVHANEPYAERLGVKLECHGMDKPVKGYCDSDRIFQVMNNLLSNAAKFSERGGKVIVSLSETEDDVTIRVQDFGSGIPPEAQPGIFERFTQADSSDRRAKGGTGLGLNIVKAIVESHDGSVAFNSEVDVGTTFTVTLPKEGRVAKEDTEGAQQIAAE